MTPTNGHLEEDHWIRDENGKLDKISHGEVFGENGQVIRLRKNTYDRVLGLLEGGKEVSLFNGVNILNNGLIELFSSNEKVKTTIAIILDERTEDGNPILDRSSFLEVGLVEMQDIEISEVDDEKVKTSLARYDGNEDLDGSMLAEWLAINIYGNPKITQKLIKGGLFYRRIKKLENVRSQKGYQIQQEAESSYSIAV